MTRISIIFSLLVLCVSCEVREHTGASETSYPVTNVEARAPSSENLAVATPGDCKTFQFRYLITENVLYTEKVRHVEVFLDDNAFSEENLKALFLYLSKQFPQPTHLTIVVNTDWKQIHLSSDCPGTGMSSRPSEWKNFDYHGATFYRRDATLYFTYNPDLKTKEEKIVSLKE